MRSRVALALVLGAVVPSCAPAACSDEDDRRLGRWVERMAGEPGPTADAAEDALVARGRDAILFLETGLYDAEPRARRRIVRALVKIGDREAAPILAHLARRDPDPDVRGDAARGIVLFETPEPARSP